MSALDRDLVRLLCQLGADRSLALSATVVGQRDWASALFTGERLTVELGVDRDGDDFDQWLADLPDIEFALRGYFVADAAVVARQAGGATIELLVIAEG